MDGDKITNHDCFGQVRFNKINCHGMKLYGSNITHEHIIELSVSTSEHARNLNNDWYHERDKIVSAYLSPSQLFEIISDMHMGNGVPCTLKFTQDKGRIQPYDFEDKVEVHRKEFTDNMKEITRKSYELENEMKEILSQKGTIKKADKEKLLRLTQMLVQDMGPNTEFAQKCFGESVEKAILEAKAEVESFVEHKVRSVGLEHLGGDMISNDMKVEIEDNTETGEDDG